MLVSDDDEVALLSERRPLGPSPRAQSPELGFAVTSPANGFRIHSLLEVELRHAYWLTDGLRKRLPDVSGLPHAMQDDGQLAGHRDDGALLAALASGRGQV